ncbi:MAG: helix-turn-helix transcriptional regulator [Clostridia bacterium]|nr:helix-turn-helix transcriptional regulator [Clostridia bacterium]
MRYIKTELHDFFPVSHIISIFYRGIPKECVCEKCATQNPHWEVLYIDRGNVQLEINREIVCLSAGQGILYAPGSAHRLISSNNEFINIFTVSFDSAKKSEPLLENKIYTFDPFEKNLISKLVIVGNRYFERWSSKPDGIKGMRPKADAPDYVIPFVKSSIEYLLTLLYQKKNNTGEIIHTKHYTTPLINQAIEYMYQNIEKKLTITDIAEHVKMSSSRFRTLFKEATNQSVIDYFNDIKIERAKILIRKNLYSISEIAIKLGYTSESYFSRHFKQKTSMTPSEYGHLVNHDYDAINRNINSNSEN